MTLRIQRTISSIVNIIYLIILWILEIIYYKKPPNVPTPEDPVFTLSATELARKIRNKEITCYDVVEAYKEQIKKVNPFINAIAENRFHAAIAEAKIYDEKLQAGIIDVETLEKEKPLYGVPFTVKECLAVKGYSHTGCTLALKGLKASSDSFVVETLRNAGAIPLCITNTPEMCGGYDSVNLLHGRTLNPYDTRYIAGGSSGGEGALLGAGASVLGVGSDLAGSIRVPALFNGVFGFKPTSVKGHIPKCDDETFLKFLSIGPLTRYAEDLSLFMKIISAKSDCNLRLDVPVDVKQLKVYYRQHLDKSFGVMSPTLEIEECVMKAAKHFMQCGVRTEKLPIEWPSTLIEIALAMFHVKNPPQLLIDVDDPTRQKNPFVELGKSLFGFSQHTKTLIAFNIFMEIRSHSSESKMSGYIKQGEIIRQKLLDLLGEDGVFICPTFRTPTIFPEINLFEILSGVYCMLFNAFGFPAVHVPMGLNQKGLPIGVQVAAAPYQDRLCLAVAKELETAFGGWVSPPSSCE